MRKIERVKDRIKRKKEREREKGSQIELREREGKRQREGVFHDITPAPFEDGLS